MNRKSIFLVCLLLVPVTIVFLQVNKTPQYEAGKKVYNQVCMSCHQVNGAGVPGLNPPLVKTDWVTGDKKRLINVVIKGLYDPIQIGGEEYVNPMPAMPQLTDEQVADVLTYVRNSFGNKASAVTAAEVKTQRAKK